MKPPVRKCDKCDKDAVVEVPVGFRSLTAKLYFCTEHYHEWSEQNRRFKEVHDTLVGETG